jgi:di-N-acetylchitobiase
MAAPDPLPISATDDATARAAWIESTIHEVQTRFLDGVVFDFEGPLLPSDIMNNNYVSLINETRVAMHAAVPGSHISVCLAWNPHGVDGRYYDNLNLIKAADLAYIMSYDTRSQILDQCVASANAALPATMWGLKEYLTLGADPQKMILGVPWYGYDYTCVGGGVGGGRGRRGGNVTTHGVGGGGGGTTSPALVMEEEDEEEEERMDPLGITCPTALVPFRGVNCSDAAGVQVPFSTIYARLVAGKTTTGRLWDDYMQTPFYNYVSEEDGSVHQVHYDDVESLRLKYGVARELGLRGVGPYTFDDLPGGGEGGGEGEEAAREMWEALRGFTDEEGEEERGGGKGGLRRGGG